MDMIRFLDSMPSTGHLTSDQSSVFLASITNASLLRRRIRVVVIPPTTEEIQGLVAHSGPLTRRLSVLGRLTGRVVRVFKIRRYLMGFTRSTFLNKLLTAAAEQHGVSLDVLRAEVRQVVVG